MSAQVIHGLNAVREALASGRRVNRVFLARESRAKNFQQVVDAARAIKVPFEFVPQAKINELTGTQEHQGIAATVSPIEYVTLDACLEQCPPVATLLLLDQVQHPRNLGMIIRSASGAGASGVVLVSRGGALLDDDVVRASAGAIFRVPVVQCGNLGTAIGTLKEAGFWVYGLDAAGSDNLFEMRWPERCAFVLGNETEGIRPGLRKNCDALVRIPLANEMDSLNVAVAAGVALFHVAAQHARP